METLVTRRLILRPLRKTDYQAMFHYAQKKHIGPMAGWRPHQNLNETKAVLDLMIKENEVWAITIKPNDILVGTIGLHAKDFFNALEFKKEIGYVLDDVYWGQEYTLEAVNAVLEYAFKVLELDIVVCGHFLTNKQSKRVIEKAGFTKTHVEMRDDANKIKKITQMYQIEKDYFLGGKNGKVKFEI
jgi:RimJ/RimL family protein N-acetyltransferase